MASRRSLTPKQAAFVAWYLSAEVGMNATEAAARAGYKGDRVTLAQTGRQNLKNPQIAKEIARELRASMKDTQVTVASVLVDLEIVYQRALAAGQYSAAARACELKGRHLKMFVDRIEHTVSLGNVTDAELADEIRATAARLGMGDVASVAVDSLIAALLEEGVSRGSADRTGAGHGPADGAGAVDPGAALSD